MGLELTTEEERPYLSDAQVDHHNLAAQLPLSQQQLQQLFQRRVHPDLQISEVIWSSHLRINQRMTSKYWDGSRVFLAGDACHCHTHLGGQGMNIGMQDACNIGWKLALVVQGLCAPPLLSTYEQERLGVAKAVVNSTGLVQKLVSVRNPVVQRSLGLVVASSATTLPVQSLLGKTTSEMIYNYRRSPVSAEHWGRSLVGEGAAPPSAGTSWSRSLLQQFVAAVSGTIAQASKLSWQTALQWSTR